MAHKKIENKILAGHKPCPNEVRKFLLKWDKDESYVDQEKALNKLFFELCKENKSIEDILIKCSTLNDFYSTNILKVHNVALHYRQVDIDRRLAEGDLSLVDTLADVKIEDKSFSFYSFASKYCSHHRPDVYPIYDNYVHQLLIYYRDNDKFCDFKISDLKNYKSYVAIIVAFKEHYHLEEFSFKEMDKYLWQLGKEAFNKYPQKQ